MKLYKFDYTGAIGDNVVNVPTDSQFLIGVGSAATSTVELYDGSTQLTPEDDKVGAYTCFRFETDGTPSRKRYKAVITPHGVEEKDLWVMPFDEAEYDGHTNIALGIPEGVSLTDLNYDAETHAAPVLESFQAYVYGVVYDTGAEYTYLKTITFTWDADNVRYVAPEDFVNDSVKYIQFTECTDEYLHAGYGVESATENEAEYDAKTTVPAPFDGTPDTFDLLVWARKQSVAYRDEEGITAAEAVEAAKESGDFLVKDDSGTFFTEETFQTTNSVIMSGPGPDFETCLELDVDAENARVNAYGTINGEDLTISDVVVENFRDDSFNTYGPMTVTVKINGEERQVRLFGFIPD